MTEGFAPINGARLHFEVEGSGPSFVMIHAGVADSRQWNNEFRWLGERAHVVRYDMRGYGRSEPVDGELRAWRGGGFAVTAEPLGGSQLQHHVLSATRLADRSDFDFGDFQGAP